MRSVVISVGAFVCWLAVVMALTVTLLKVHQDVESARSEQIEALSRGEGAPLTEPAKLDQQARASDNLFNTVGGLLAVVLAFGLVFFTIWVYRLAAAARDAQDLIEFEGLASAMAGEDGGTLPEPAPPAAEQPSIPAIAGQQPDLLEPEPAAEAPPPKPAVAAAPVPPEPEPAPTPATQRAAASESRMRASVSILPARETISRAGLDEIFESLAPPDKERRYRFDLLRRAGLQFPPLDAELERLLELASQPKTYLQQLVREVSRHPVLAQKLIRLANSLYYAPPKAVRDLNYALVVLGAEGVRSGAIAQAVHDAFDFAEPLQVELWHYSIAVAIAAALIGRAVRHGKPDELYSQGLAHGVGRMVLVSSRRTECVRLADLMQSEDVPALDVEREAFGFCSVDVGAVALAVWGLPRTFQGVAMYAFDRDAPGLSAFGHEAVVAATVLDAAAAIVKKVIGVGAIPSDAAVALPTHSAIRSLGLDEHQLDTIGRDLRDMYPEHRDFL